MMTAALFFAGKDWLWPALIGSLAALAIVAISYARTPAPRGIRLACAALKIAGFAALLFFLLDPMWTSERAKPGANLIAVVADNSASMDLHGGGETEPRANALRRSVTGEQNLWLRQLGETFEVRNYLCDTRLSPVEDFTALDFKGRASAFGAALKQVRDRHRGQPLAGIVLLTDGLIPDLADLEAADLPPVYPVLYGSAPPASDLAIASTAVTQSSFEDAPVGIQAEVTALGFAGKKVVGELIPVATGENEPKPLLTEELTAPKDSDKLVFRFQVRPEKAGVTFYRVRVRAKNSADEATLENNETLVTVDRGAGPYRVLYVSGRPNWEYKFLHRALESDPETDLVGLIRIARREPKFEFRGRAGESSNPLFRGFGTQSAEETEQYDQPVLLRLNTRDETELSGGFPKTAKELFGFRAVIVDDLEAAFFSADQKLLLQRFVSERGGGFLMLGGAESFAEGKYDRTPIGDLLPVYLSEAAAAKETAPGAAYRLKLTREGWLQTWARLRRSEPEESTRLEALPPFDVLHRLRGLKPAAMVIAAASDGTREVPALATQRFGRGRASAMLLGDFWQSGLGDEARQKDLGKAWRQLVRWLIADVPDAVEVRAEPEPGAEAMRIQVRVRDDEFQPLDNARVSISVLTDQSPEPVVLNAGASSEEPGLFEAQYFPRESGGYRVEVEATDESGAVAGKAATGWATNFAAAEFGTLTPDRAALEALAQKTGGELLTPEGLENLARRLPGERAPVTETVTQPLWHTPAFFLFALVCFTGEWGLRRWKGLA